MVRHVDFARVAGARRRLDQVVRDHPELTEPEARDRLGLALPILLEEPMSPSPTFNLSLRVDQGLVEEADALIPVLQRSPLAAFGAVKRSSVLRLALAEGLTVLAEKYAKQGEVAP